MEIRENQCMISREFTVARSDEGMPVLSELSH